METYNVKQIAYMLNTQPETVRRWIRNGKLKAERASRKEGHVITENDLNKFLRTSPKYAGILAGAVIGATAFPILPLAGGMTAAAAYMTAVTKVKKLEYSTLTKDELKLFLHGEIERKIISISQKAKSIGQLQDEIACDRQQIEEWKSVLEQLEKDE